MNQEKKGVVSVWVGKFTNEVEFENYITEKYGQIDDSTLSEFAKDSGLKWYDHDLREADFNSDGLVSIRTLLLQTSYSESFIDNVVQKAKNKNLEKGNAIFLLFDCDYSGVDNSKSKFQFIASVPYDKSFRPAIE
jgi:hypothetical protein